MLVRARVRATFLYSHIRAIIARGDSSRTYLMRWTSESRPLVCSVFMHSLTTVLVDHTPTPFWLATVRSRGSAILNVLIPAQAH